MLLDAKGRPTSSGARRGMQLDAFQQHGLTSINITLAMQNKLRNDTKFRERVELAQKIRKEKYHKTGEVLHLALLKRGGMESKTERALIDNQKFGEKIIRKRIKDNDLKGNGDYGKLQNVG
jgi:hypothetical protein